MPSGTVRRYRLRDALTEHNRLASLDTDVQFLAITAAKMPFIGRG